MTAKTLIASALLTVLPMIAIAQEGRSCEEVHANCQAGTVYDAEKKTCVVVSS
ncbi:MAG: hypothetical protein VX874_16880 [Pseudomonadota bacterium]|nr:hypothetical protein [Pseudomonadota bacterium]